MSPKTSRNLFYGFLVLCFLLGVFFKQFDLFYPTHLFLALIAFSGAIGLLWEYAWKIRKSRWALVPFLVALEFFGDVLQNAGLWDFSFYIYLISMLVFPVYGGLFIHRGTQLFGGDRGLGVKFIVLGVLATSLLSWEIATYFPDQIDSSHIWFRALFLAVFAWLLVIDFTTDFSKRPEMKIERDILRMSLLVMSAWYFVRFVFK